MTVAERDETATRDIPEQGSRFLSVLDRALYALFSRHADSNRHDADRKRYRATDVTASSDVYLSRTYGLSWLAFALVAGWTFVVVVALPALGHVKESTDQGLGLQNPTRR